MYKKSYFYIESGYMMTSDEQYEKFFDEIVNLFATKGWEIKRPRSMGVCPEVKKDKTELYIHPTSVSGNIDIELKEEIESILKCGTTFSYVRNKDYGEVFDWSDEEYLNYLAENKDAIKTDILESFKTKRSNLYIYSDFFTGPLRNICDKYRKPRLTDDTLHSGNKDYNYIGDLFKKLITEGEILAGKTNSGICYRTAKPIETQAINDFKKWCEENNKSICDTSVSEYAHSTLDLSSKADGKNLNLLFNFSQVIESMYGNQSKIQEDDEDEFEM